MVLSTNRSHSTPKCCPPANFVYFMKVVYYEIPDHMPEHHTHTLLSVCSLTLDEHVSLIIKVIFRLQTALMGALTFVRA